MSANDFDMEEAIKFFDKKLDSVLRGNADNELDNLQDKIIDELCRLGNSNPFNPKEIDSLITQLCCDAEEKAYKYGIIVGRHLAELYKDLKEEFPEKSVSETDCNAIQEYKLNIHCKIDTSEIDKAIKKSRNASGNIKRMQSAANTLYSN